MSSSARLRRHRAQQWHRDHVRPETDVDLGSPELGVVGGDDEVARAGEAEATSKRVAAHAGDRRLAEAPQVAEQIGEQAPPLVRRDGLGVARYAAEVGAGAERLVARAR